MRRLRRRTIAGVLALVGAVGVAGGAWWATRGSAATCAGLYDRASRLACRARLGLDEAGDMRDIRKAVDQSSDPTERDLLLLRLVLDDPHRGRWACEQIADPRLGAWCDDAKGRTHLAPQQEKGRRASGR
jgi:hypothetical protein